MSPLKMKLSAVILLTVLVSSLSAGVLVVSAQTSTLRPDQKETTQIYVDADRLRIETKGGAMSHVVIFRQDKQLFWMIDSKDGSYMEMRKEDVQQIQATMNESMKALEAQMKNLPPEQRQMMEQMMKGKMSTATPKKAPQGAYKKTASGEKVNQWICDKYEGYFEGKKIKELWTTDWKQFGLSAEEFNVFKEIGEFFEGLAKNAPMTFDKVGSEEWAKEQGYAGIPVKTLSYLDGQLQGTMEITAARRQDFNASLFDLPAGLKKKEFPGSRTMKP